MNIFSKKLIIAAASALVLFATGCTKKPSRPTPDQTMIGGGSGTVSTVDTSATDSSQYANQSGAGQNYGITQQTSTTELTQKTEGDREGNQIRNVPGLLPIYFGFDRSAIEKNERTKFQAIKDYLAKNPNYRVLFEGHCDWRGTADYNMALGDRRANSAKKYAASVGIDPSKIEVKSMGSTKAMERAAEDVMAKDRRAEVVILVQ